MLASSLEEWQKEKKRGVWLHLSIDASSLIPIATKEFGFEFHHAEPDHVMMTKWLPTDAPNTLPANASHTIGVGAVVTNSEGQVLLVRERSGPAGRSGVWKIPTGMVDAGEDLHDAAVREVKE
ncbi:NUDT8, partial [Symbiodinium necroappetens]